MTDEVRAGWIRWWNGLDPDHRQCYRDHQHRSFRLATHELVEGPDGAPVGVVRTGQGAGSFGVPDFLLMLDEPPGQK